jgi:hypothetical protein
VQVTVDRRNSLPARPGPGRDRAAAGPGHLRALRTPHDRAPPHPPRHRGPRLPMPEPLHPGRWATLLNHARWQPSTPTRCAAGTSNAPATAPTSTAAATWPSPPGKRYQDASAAASQLEDRATLCAGQPGVKRQILGEGEGVVQAGNVGVVPGLVYEHGTPRRSEWQRIGQGLSWLGCARRRHVFGNREANDLVDPVQFVWCSRWRTGSGTCYGRERDGNYVRRRTSMPRPGTVCPMTG